MLTGLLMGLQILTVHYRVSKPTRMYQWLTMVHMEEDLCKVDLLLAIMVAMVFVLQFSGMGQSTLMGISDQLLVPHLMVRIHLQHKIRASVQQQTSWCVLQTIQFPCYCVAGLSLVM